MQKRLFSFVIALVMLLSCFPLSIFAAEEEACTIRVEECQGTPGSTVEVSVMIENNPGILGATLNLSWDAGITLTSVECGDAFSMLNMTKPNKWQTSGGNYIFYGEALSDNEVIDGSILDLTFTVDTAAEFGTSYGIYVSYTDGDIFDKDLNMVDPAIVNGKIDITYLPGDVNGDKRINALDLILLCRFIADGSVNDPNGYNTNINELAGDVDANGRWNALDLIYICRYIADGCKTDPDGYNVILKHSTSAHTHRMTAIDAKEATCTEDGNIAYWYCAACGKYYSDAEGVTQITLADTVTKAAHTPGAEATCTAAQICTVCGEVIAAALGHTYSTVWSSDSEYHWHTATCEHDGEMTDKDVHSFNASHVCTVCNYDNSGAYKLATPADVRVEYDEVKWTAVPNADYYTVRVNGDYEFVTRATSCALSAVENSSNEKLFANKEGINKHGEVYVIVMANDNGNYTKSDFSDLVTAYYIPEVGDSENKTTADNYKLGNGYNLIEQTFSTGITSLGSVFNLGKLLSIDTFSHSTEGAGGSLSNYYFTSADDYVANYSASGEINTEVGAGYGPVSASLSMDLSFSSAENYKSHRYNATYISRFDQIAGTTKFGMQNADVRIHALSNQFVKDIKRESVATRLLTDEDLCEYIFNNYGTHTVLGVQRGANFVTSYVISTDNEEDSKSATAMFKVGANSKVANFFNASLDVSAQESSTITITSETTVSTLKSSYYGGKVAAGVAEGKASIESWDGSANPVTIGLTNAIAISSVIEAFEAENNVYFGNNGTKSFGGIYAAYVADRATDLYNDLYSKYTYTPPFDVEVTEENGENVLVIDLSKYQGTGDLSDAGCSYMIDGEFTVYPNMLGKRIDNVRVTSNFDNGDVSEKNLLDGFALKLSSNWKRDVDVEIENLGVRTLENGLVDKTKTSGITANVLYSGINFIELPDGTKEMYVATDTEHYSIAFDLADGEILDMSTVYMDGTETVLPVAEKVGYSFAGWFDASNTAVADKQGVLDESYVPSNNTVLHPVWTRVIYEITLNSQSASEKGTTAIYEQYAYIFANDSDEKITSITVPVKTGYSFEGYYLSVSNNSSSNATGENQIIDSDGNIVADADFFTAHTTVYALWQPQTYTVTLYNGDAICGKYYQVYGEGVYDESMVALESVEIPSNTGYTFAGFATEEGDNFIDEDGNILAAINGNYKTVTEDTELYAKWTANEYTVTLDANGGEVSAATKTVTFDEAYGELPTPTREGHTFDGWYLSENKVTADTIVKTAGHHTLTAKWTGYPYTVEYNANGGSGTVASDTHTYGKEYTLSDNANGFARNGYDFAGWNTKADGTGTSYAAGQTVSNLTTEKDGTVTLYADWANGTGDVTLDANGGSVSPAKLEDVVFDTAYGTLPTPTRTGYTFDGWYLSENKVTADTIVKTAGHHTLTAKWTLVPYTATWGTPANATIIVKRTSSPIANAATGTISSGATVYYGDVLSITYAAATGYSISSKGATSITVTGNVTSSDIYASASVNQYTATWSTPANATITVKRTSSPKANAATGTISSGATVYYGDVLSITYAAATGYSISSKGATSITVTGNITSSNIYVTPKANTYTVVYNANGGSGTTASSTHTYNVSKALTSNGFSRSNYVFLGWSKSNTATSPTYSNGYSVKNLATSGSVTLYAVWMKVSGTAGYYSRGDAGDEANFINSSSTKTENFNVGLNRSQLQSNGYTKVKIEMQVNGWENWLGMDVTPIYIIYDYNGASLLRYNGDKYACGDGGEDWKRFNYTFTLDISAVRNDGSIKVGYTSVAQKNIFQVDTSGWHRGTVEITATAIK